MCDTVTSTNAIICNTSIECNSLKVGNTSYQLIGGNHFIDVQNPNAYMYFRINGETVASLTSRNQIVLDDPRRYGLDLLHNDLTNVYYMNVSYCEIQNTSITNMCCTNACFVNISVTNFYADPAIIDNCSFVYNVCMNNCSIVNLDISGNVSFQNLKNINTSLSNLSQSVYNLNSCVQNISFNYWSTKNDVSLLNTCLSNVSRTTGSQEATFRY